MAPLPGVLESPRVVAPRAVDGDHVVLRVKPSSLARRAQVIVGTDQALVTVTVDWTAAAIADDVGMEDAMFLLGRLPFSLGSWGPVSFPFLRFLFLLITLQGWLLTRWSTEEADCISFC